MRINKFFSIFLSLLMVCSIFGGLSVSATTIDKTHTYTVVGDAPFLGAKWDPTTVADDMVVQSDGTYKKTYTNVSKSDCYSIKVTEDHDWSVNFGSNLGENDPQNIEFSVPMDNSTVDVILTLKGTRNKDGKVITDGFVKVLVDGVDAPGKVVPTETTHYVAGEAGLCNGINWEKDNEINKMTKNQDGSYEITLKGVNPKTDGTPYEFYVTTNGQWEPGYVYYGEKDPGSENALLTITEPNSTVKIVLTAKLKVRVYVNDKEVTPEMRKSEFVTSLGGTYTGPINNKSKRYFFAMPEKWFNFSNATACAFWWSGEDACYDQQHSYIMRPTSIKTDDDSVVYYIDVAENVHNIIFTNGIEGSEKRPLGNDYDPNYNKNLQTFSINLDRYKAGECDLYPDGVDNFDNMIYVVDSNSRISVDPSGYLYKGNWYYLHSDGKWDTSKGSTYEIHNTNVKLNTRSANLTVDNFVYLVPTFENVRTEAEIKWTSSNPEVATVDNNGKVTAKSVGDATISISVQNPDDKEPVVTTCKIKVNNIDRIAVTKLPNKTEYTEGEGLDISGLEVTVYYKDGTSKVVENYTLDYDLTKVGERTVTVQHYDYIDTFKVKVNPKTEPTNPTKPTVKKVTKVEVNKKSVALLNGRSAVVKATVTPNNATNKKLKWTTSNSKVAIVNSQGKITAKGRGNATIKAMELDGSNKYATVKVTVKQPVTSVKLNRNSAILKVKGNAKHKTVTLKATVNPKNANVKSVKWTTSKSKIATVNSKGKVTAKKKGTCFIYATAKDGSKKYAKCKITVK